MSPGAVQLERTAAGVVLRLRAAPGASREGVVGVHDGAVKVAVQAPPERGRANRRLLEVLAKALGLPPRTLTLIAGDTSRDKRVLVGGVSVEQVQAALDRCLPR